ncbi:hybrid sensor histidine kinase/response regulator [Dyella subtropica]|uniref:hybrid sensor histidine kinase/response regulator n=1 Tax=Dyella subtropica TaxID=2992127 RepID=UPI002258D596|nr:response regulator [Dyella subtropica]
MPVDPDMPVEPSADDVTQAQPVQLSLAPETVRVSIAKLDTVMHHVEELLGPRLAARQRAQELREAGAAFALWKKQRLRLQPSLRLLERAFLSESRRMQPNGSRDGTGNGVAGRTQELSRLLEYLDAEQVQMKVLEDRLARLSQSAEHDQRTLAGMTDSLLRDVKEMQLLPFSSLIEVFPRLVRELAREQGKKVELVIQGGEIEIDRRILDAMKDPLIHLLRNSVDHGIEKPSVREAKGKPPRGRVTLSISQIDSGKVEVVVADDGAGIDAASVQAAARKLGVAATRDAGQVDEKETLALVFRSGISTSPIITDVSGRGLGLAIVREKVERLGGNIAIESQAGARTRFRIALPLMLANFRGVLVRSGGQIFAIPAVHIERVSRIAQSDIRTVENRETMLVDGEAVSLVWLSDVLELPRPHANAQQTDYVWLVVLGMAHLRVAFRVEEVIDEHEVLVKHIGRQLERVRNVAGASVLGTGQIVPVLNVSDLLKSAIKHVSVPMPVGTSVSAGNGTEVENPSILVVEDSITSRSLLKGILESAGFGVTTAVDGADAYTTLKTGSFDLVVSDVEMPRMDGFDLTAKLRADKQLAELPIVLVTALGSREHRERGIDVGANAYIVKSSFDQSNLLEVIRRLL